MAPLKIVFDSRHQQRLAKAPGATEEIDAFVFGQFINHVGLVYINKTIIDDTCEVLYAYWIVHLLLLLLPIANIGNIPQNTKE